MHKKLALKYAETHIDAPVSLDTPTAKNRTVLSDLIAKVASDSSETPTDVKHVFDATKYYYKYKAKLTTKKDHFRKQNARRANNLHPSGNERVERVKEILLHGADENLDYENDEVAKLGITRARIRNIEKKIAGTSSLGSDVLGNPKIPKTNEIGVQTVNGGAREVEATNGGPSMANTMVNFSARSVQANEREGGGETGKVLTPILSKRKRFGAFLRKAFCLGSGPAA